MVNYRRQSLGREGRREGGRRKEWRKYVRNGIGEVWVWVKPNKCPFFFFFFFFFFVKGILGSNALLICKTKGEVVSMVPLY